MISPEEQYRRWAIALAILADNFNKTTFGRVPPFEGSSQITQASICSHFNISEMTMIFSLRRLFTPRAGITLALLLAPSALAFLVFSLERHYAETRFRELAEQRILSIRSYLGIAESSVNLIAAHFAVSDTSAASRNGFLQLVSGNLKAHPVAQAYSFNPLVSREDLKEHEIRTRLNGHSDYVVVEKDENGKSRPVSPRATYVPIQYIEPHSELALGFDLASDATRQVALRKAHETRATQVTSRIKLVQHDRNPYGVLLLAPVFDATGQSGDIAKGALKGYVSGVIHINSWMNSTNIAGYDQVTHNTTTDSAGYDRLTQPLVEIRLIDASAPEGEQSLYPAIDETRAEHKLSRFRITETFSFGGRDWKIVAHSSDTFNASSIPLASTITLLLGLLASGILLYYLKNRIEQAEEVTRYALTTMRANERLTEAQRIARLATLEFDLDQEIMDLGEGVEVMLGLVPGNAATLRELLMNVDRNDRLDFVDLLYSASEAPQTMDIKISSSETDRMLELIVSRVGNSRQARVIMQDITQRKIEERDRSEMIDRVSEAERLSALGTMAGGIAHEINTPVQYIGDNLRFIKDQVEGLLVIAERADRSGVADGSPAGSKINHFDLEFAREETPSAINQALEGIDQVARIARAIKEYSHPTGDNFSITDLNHAIETAVTITRNQWKYATELQLDLEPNLPHISAVKGEVNQILVNLIVNASQAIAEMGENSLGHILVSTRRIDNEVSITVRDNGPGISPANLKKIFDLFFTTKPPGMGTGQGLALVKSIARRHGGEISVESELGKGTSFVLRLPIEQTAHKRSDS